MNASINLEHYSFLSPTVVRFAPWLLRYDDLLCCTGETNTEPLTADRTYVRERGCRVAPCLRGGGTPLTSYAEYVSTGRTGKHNRSSTILAATSSSR